MNRHDLYKLRSSCKHTHPYDFSSLPFSHNCHFCCDYFVISIEVHSTHLHIHLNSTRNSVGSIGMFANSTQTHTFPSYFYP